MNKWKGVALVAIALLILLPCLAIAYGCANDINDPQTASNPITKSLANIVKYVDAPQTSNNTTNETISLYDEKAIHPSGTDYSVTGYDASNSTPLTDDDIIVFATVDNATGVDMSEIQIYSTTEDIAINTTNTTQITPTVNTATYFDDVTPKTECEPKPKTECEPKPKTECVDTNKNVNSNATIVDNSGFVNPTYSQLISFLANDNTDLKALPDNEATVQLAKSATTAKYHNQIMLLIFGNGQTYAVNRFILNDNSFVYVDNSKTAGFLNDGTHAMDRILIVLRDKPITYISPYQTDIVYTYPTTSVSYGIKLWSI